MSDTQNAKSSFRCQFRSSEGRPCKRWPLRGSCFCHGHQPNSDHMNLKRWASVHPLARLATPNDLFDVVRETLNAARQGRISVQQAYAVGYLAKVWLLVHRQVSEWTRNDAQFRQMLPTLVDGEAAAVLEAERRANMPLPVRSIPAPHAACSAPSEISDFQSDLAATDPSSISDFKTEFPLPVEIDEEAHVAAPPRPRTAAQAKAEFDAAVAAMPKPQLEPLESYPGFLELEQRGKTSPFSGLASSSAPAASGSAAAAPTPAASSTPSEISDLTSAIPPRSPSEISDLRSAIPLAPEPVEAAGTPALIPNEQNQPTLNPDFAEKIMQHLLRDMFRPNGRRSPNRGSNGPSPRGPNGKPRHSP